MRKALIITVKTIKYTILTVLLLLVSVNIYFAIAVKTGNPVPSIFGYSQMSVLTESMKPEIPKGSLIFISQKSEYGIGDDVTFLNTGATLPVTHRIVAVNGSTITTKGVANDVADTPIDISQVKGKVIKVMPGFGNLLAAFKTPNGMFFVAAIGLLVVFLPEYLIGLFVSSEKKNENKKRNITLKKTAVAEPSYRV
jgi:signal peptidase I